MAVAALFDVEVKMVLVVGVVAGTEHGREMLAGVAPHAVQKAALALR